MADEVLPCKYCNKTFRTQIEWKEHVSTNHDVTGYPCDLCTEVFYKEHDYIQHFNAEHKSDFNRHVCSFCGVSYKWFKFLEQHIQKKHQIETLKQCDRCGEEFYNSMAFRQHLKLKHVSGKKFHKCMKCHRSFTAKSFLQMHDKFDHNKRGAKLFKEYVLDNLNLDSESLLDSTKKCSQCDLQFSSSVYLFKHFKQAHNKKKYYQCCECNEAVYNTRAGLSIHLHYEHAIAREHKCVKCMTGHLTPPKTDKRTKPETTITKEVLSPSSLPPWSDQFKNKDLPDDLELVGASELELSNLRSNIRNLFHLLATVTPSKLKATQKSEGKTDTFFSMKNFKSDEIGKDGRRRYEIEPKDLKFEKSFDKNPTDKDDRGTTRRKSASVAKETEKQPCANAKETSANNVKQKTNKPKVHFQCHKCKDKFSLRKALNVHIMNVHGFKGFPSSSRKGEDEHELLSKKCEEIEKYSVEKMTEDNKNSDTPKYKCNSCNIEFHQQVLLLNHLTERHTADSKHVADAENSVVFKCPECYVAFNTENELSAHMNGHTKQDENAKKVCKVCKKHMKKSKTIYKCRKCERKFAKRNVLHRHIKKQHKMQIFKCAKCNASFKIADKLKQHMKLKHNASEATTLPVLKLQKSKLSPIKLDKLPNILSNILTKNLLNGTLHNCKICNSYFPSNVLLQRHIQWEHTKNVNLHKCGQCNQVLYSVEDLDLHTSTAHSSEGPFKWKKQIAFNYEHQTDI